MSDRTATIVIGVVTTIWAASHIAGMLQINDYQPSEAVNGIFMAVVGGAFALRHRNDTKPPTQPPNDQTMPGPFPWLGGGPRK